MKIRASGNFPEPAPLDDEFSEITEGEWIAIAAIAIEDNRERWRMLNQNIILNFAGLALFVLSRDSDIVKDIRTFPPESLLYRLFPSICQAIDVMIVILVARLAFDLLILKPYRNERALRTLEFIKSNIKKARKRALGL